MRIRIPWLAAIMTALFAAPMAFAQQQPVKIRIAWVVPVIDPPSILYEKPAVLQDQGDQSIQFGQGDQLDRLVPAFRLYRASHVVRVDLVHPAYLAARSDQPAQLILFFLFDLSDLFGHLPLADQYYRYYHQNHHYRQSQEDHEGHAVPAVQVHLDLPLVLGVREFRL